MKFSTSKLELQKALQKLSKATPTRTTLPILGCVFVEETEEKTLLKTTDLEITIQDLPYLTLIVYLFTFKVVNCGFPPRPKNGTFIGNETTFRSEL